MNWKSDDRPPTNPFALVLDMQARIRPDEIRRHKMWPMLCEVRDTTLMTHDFSTIEQLAKRLCQESGGDWDKKRTKRNHWRRKAGDLYANQKPATRESLYYRLKRDIERALFGALSK